MPSKVNWFAGKIILRNTENETIEDLKVLKMDNCGITTEGEVSVFFNPWQSVRFIAKRVK